jgi:hypothetical protein
MRGMREAIVNSAFAGFRDNVRAAWQNGDIAPR